jgi:hypothetical protein
VLALSKVLGAYADNAGGELSADSMAACADAMKGFAGGARDSDLKTDPGEKIKGGTQEKAMDARTLGASHPLAGCGDYLTPGRYDPRYSIDAVLFAKGDGATEHSVGSIFLAKG